MAKTIAPRAKKKAAMLKQLNGEVYKTFQGHWRCRLCKRNFGSSKLKNFERHIDTIGHRTLRELENKFRAVTTELTRVNETTLE